MVYETILFLPLLGGPGGIRRTIFEDDLSLRQKSLHGVRRAEKDQRSVGYFVANRSIVCGGVKVQREAGEK